MDAALDKLCALYDGVPGVPCLACGACCVSPTCTLLEFLYLMRHLLTTHPKETIRAMLCTPPALHPDYEGNLRCKVHDKVGGRCLVHPSRTLACRLFGLPAISEFQIADLENCRKTDPSTKPSVERTQIEGWLLELTRLNTGVAPFYCEPYWIAGLNIECWLAVYFDPLLNHGIFGAIKDLLRQWLDLSFIEDVYRDRTELKDKTDKIGLLYELLKMGDTASVVELTQSIRNDYPLTGTYYLDELDKIERMVKKNIDR